MKKRAWEEEKKTTTTTDKNNMADHKTVERTLRECVRAAADAGTTPRVCFQRTKTERKITVSDSRAQKEADDPPEEEDDEEDDEEEDDEEDDECDFEATSKKKKNEIPQFVQWDWRIRMCFTPCIWITSRVRRVFRN